MRHEAAREMRAGFKQARLSEFVWDAKPSSRLDDGSACGSLHSWIVRSQVLGGEWSLPDPSQDPGRAERRLYSCLIIRPQLVEEKMMS